LSVEPVPSVIESPSVTTVTALRTPRVSTASRKYQDVLVYGKASSLSS
jgi:hypothetical protein